MRVSVKKKNMFRIAGLITGFWVLSLPAADSIYKWVDEDGSIHYSDQPPPQVYKPEKVRLDLASSDHGVLEAQEKAASLSTKQQTGQDQRTATREQERLQTKLEQVKRNDRQRRCIKAHEELQSLDHHMPIYYIDEKGDWVFLNDKERADLIKFYHSEINMFCD
jgi:Domain of unknown function (DUF4124)